MAAVLERRVDATTDLIPAKEFAKMVSDTHERESASNGPFVKAFAAGKLTREQLKRWGKEWYHYNMWMCPSFLGTPNLFRMQSKESFYTRVDNIEGEFGYKKWKAHPYLAADLPLSLGATMQEIEDYIPLPTTIFYARSNKGHEAGVVGAAAFMVEMDNQRCSSIVLDTLRTRYGISGEAADYFEVHKEADIEHSQEYLAVLADMCKTRADQESALRKGALSLRERCVCWNGWMALLQ